MELLVFHSSSICYIYNLETFGMFKAPSLIIIVFIYYTTKLVFNSNKSSMLTKYQQH